MAPRGLSAEEKRVKLLEIFHESRDFYQLKELEKLGPKLKGIVSQSVKEVLQSLVDDGLVQADKIGASNFFWSFPSQQGVFIQRKLTVAQEANQSLQKQIAELEAAINTEKADRRTEALKSLTTLKKDLSTLEAELNAYGDSNPAKVEEAKRAAFLAKEATYRWTDNYGVLLSHFTRQNGASPDEIRQYLGVGEDYEDLD
ncbi:meiotic nuclear division protein 1 [Crepidotus variabilis]|uniref:Meiotic nuclear division protein 1 n=1 Tax=Crepidotus variabilis TaxID=179855 RepID=A0A9P6JTA6_9AGAR|nr:meiotic nuclear division protein 1 [Crepidotus variabilis]